MKKIELKDAIEKEVIKRKMRHFALAGGRNLGVLEFTKEEIKQREFKNSEINKINSNVHALKENIESFANWFYNLDKKIKKISCFSTRLWALWKTKRELSSALLKEMKRRDPMSYGR